MKEKAAKNGDLQLPIAVVAVNIMRGIGIEIEIGTEIVPVLETETGTGIGTATGIAIVTGIGTEKEIGIEIEIEKGIETGGKEIESGAMIMIGGLSMLREKVAGIMTAAGTMVVGTIVVGAGVGTGVGAGAGVEVGACKLAQPGLSHDLVRIEMEARTRRLLPVI